MNGKSPIERLRGMLDERGVEWHESNEQGATFWNGQYGIGYYAKANDDGETLRILGVNLTPEQAIAATLGSGECEDTNERFNAWTCSECKATLLLMFDDYGEPTYSVNGVADVPRFCPNCGKAVKR